MKSRLTGALQIAAVYVGTIVGAGFATGREIAQFFTQYGFWGLIGLLCAGWIFIFTGTKIMLLSVRAGAAGYEEFNRCLFGAKIGNGVNLLFMAMLLGVTAVMISGAGAVFEEQLGLSRQLGTGITVVLAIMVLLVGLKGIFLVNSFVVPLMVFFSVLLCILTLSAGGIPDYLFSGHRMSLDVIMSPFAYTAFNLSLSQAVLVPVAFEVKDERVIRAGGMLGGGLLTIILLTGHLSLSSLPNVMAYEIPAAELMKIAAGGMYWIFILVIYGEIFTSVIGNIFGLERQIKQHLKLPGYAAVLLICGISIIISRFNYGEMLGYLYPVFGYISLVFLILIWLKPGGTIKRQ